jgi:hypothetical protein
MTDAELARYLRATAESEELAAIDFIDNDGKLATYEYTIIRCTFHNGTVIDVPRRLEKFFNRQKFNLREKRMTH